MPSLPDTRYSLIARLPPADVDAGDQAAWQEFVEAYEPFLYGFARKHGMQDADANELVQLVLLAVAKHVRKWQPTDEHQSRPPFRAWLTTVARNQLINHWKASRGVGQGGTTNLRRLHDQVAVGASNPQDEQIAYRREVLQYCAARVKQEVQSQTWQAFWATTAQGMTCSEAADELGMKLGSVYAARTRVIARLRAEATRLVNEEAEGTR